jgi:hypothetical protein
MGRRVELLTGETERIPEPSDMRHRSGGCNPTNQSRRSNHEPQQSDESGIGRDESAAIGMNRAHRGTNQRRARASLSVPAPLTNRTQEPFHDHRNDHIPRHPPDAFAPFHNPPTKRRKPSMPWVEPAPTSRCRRKMKAGIYGVTDSYQAASPAILTSWSGVRITPGLTEDCGRGQSLTPIAVP